MKSLWVGSESGWSGSGSRNGSWQTLTITTIYIDFPGQEKFCRESEAANCNCRNFCRRICVRRTCEDADSHVAMFSRATCALSNCVFTELTTGIVLEGTKVAAM